jgi:hypothetical protein
MTNVEDKIVITIKPVSIKTARQIEVAKIAPTKKDKIILGIIATTFPALNSWQTRLCQRLP